MEVDFLDDDYVGCICVGDCVGKMRFSNGTWGDILRMYVFRG